MYNRVLHLECLGGSNDADFEGSRQEEKDHGWQEEEDCEEIAGSRSLGCEKGFSQEGRQERDEEAVESLQERSQEEGQEEGCNEEGAQQEENRKEKFEKEGREKSLEEESID